jgi:hypothetical protein
MTAAWITGVQARLKLWPGEAVRHARVVQSLPLGPGSRLLVVEFGGRRVLVGQARGGLVTLAEAGPEA